MTAPTYRLAPTVTPVPHGTAEALAPVAFFATIEGAYPSDDRQMLRLTYRHLLGAVADVDQLWQAIRPDCLHLYRLLADDYDWEDVDELPDLPQYEALIGEQALLEAAALKRDELVARIEQRILLARYGHAERQRPQQAGVAA